MPNIDILVLGIVQGLTEFLPVSSSGHLILVPKLFCWPDQGQTLDVAAHIGTLAAVLLYFWRDVGNLAIGCLRILQRKRDPRAYLVWLILVATIPALIVGLILQQFSEDIFRNPLWIGINLIVFGILLYVADKMGLTIRRLEHMDGWHALMIGFFQCLAYIPGTSRSGITMTVARLLGYERPEAARFSFLLSIPTIAAAGLYKGVQLFSTGSSEAIHRALLMTGISAIAGFFAIAFMMYWMRRASFAPFVVYRLLLGAFVIYALYAGLKPFCA